MSEYGKRERVQNSKKNLMYLVCGTVIAVLSQFVVDKL